MADKICMIVVAIYLIIVYKEKGNDYFEIVPLMDQEYQWKSSYIIDLKISIQNMEYSRCSKNSFLIVGHKGNSLSNNHRSYNKGFDNPIT